MSITKTTSSGDTFCDHCGQPILDGDTLVLVDDRDGACTVRCARIIRDGRRESEAREAETEVALARRGVQI